MRLSDLQHKDIIDVKTGSKIGNIIDITISDIGNMESLIVLKSKFFAFNFNNINEIEIKWSQIEKIGEDVILVKI